MCCFAGPVTEVANTRIFARRTGPGTQALVYQMRFASQSDNAMILPVPVKTPAAEGSLRFVDIKEYDDFFSDLADGFPVQPAFWQFLSLSKGGEARSASASALGVHEVGDYVASFVPSIGDFDRLDPRFRIAPEVWSQLPEYADYGFAVFQLKTKQGTPHPMAFEFDTRLQDEIFFPTVHIHDGAVHDAESFDHTLYVQDAAFDAVVGDYDDHDVLDSATGLVRSENPADHFASAGRSKGLIDASQLVHRRDLHGQHPNKDQILAFPKASMLTPGIRKWGLRSVPLLIGAAGLGFLIARRNRRAARRSR